jgi:hypothetical protein
VLKKNLKIENELKVSHLINLKRKVN